MLEAESKELFKEVIEVARLKLARDIKNRYRFRVIFLNSITGTEVCVGTLTYSKALGKE